jgi:hypothetical protein
MTPAYRKLFRTLFFMIALGVMTAYVIAEEGNATILLVYMIGSLVVYGVDHIRVEYGKLTLELGSESDEQTKDSQTPIDTEAEE